MFTNYERSEYNSSSLIRAKRGAKIAGLSIRSHGVLNRQRSPTSTNAIRYGREGNTPHRPKHCDTDLSINLGGTPTSQGPASRLAAQVVK